MGYYKTKRPFLVKYVIKTNRLKTGNTRPLKLKSLEVKVDNNITSHLDFIFVLLIIYRYQYFIKEPVIVIKRNTHNAFHDLIGMVSFIELASYVLVEHPLPAV
jgi:hypothetical protein